MRILGILFMAVVALSAAAFAQETKAGEKRVTLVGCVVARDTSGHLHHDARERTSRKCGSGRRRNFGTHARCVLSIG